MSSASAVHPGPLPPLQVACLCTGVTYEEIAAQRLATPGISVQALGAALGCGQQCGSCLPHLAEALGKKAWYRAHATATPLSQAETTAELEYLIYEVALTVDAADYPLAQPGQHVVLKVLIHGVAVERTYTVVEQQANRQRLKLAMRRNPQGVFTPFLVGADRASAPIALEISAPGGPGFSVDVSRPTVFFAGGIGITPAVALLESLPDSAQAYLDYSSSGPQEAVYTSRFAQVGARMPGFLAKYRYTQAEGRITEEEVAAIAAQRAGAQFFVCGPDAYVAKIQSALVKAHIPLQAIRVELFSMAAGLGAPMSFRAKLYWASSLVLVALLCVLFLGLEAERPHGHPNVGHAELKCVACHAEAPGSTRQVFQAKVKHLVGLRETGAVFGKLPVTNAVCVQCHANPDDRHPANRFLEPRFDAARDAVGAHQCASCHREHSEVRIAVANTSFCVHCHQDLKIKNDTVQPSHAELLQKKSWNTCMQCHDYHGNHEGKTPLNLVDAADLGSISNYLRQGDSPYGSTVIKAKNETPP